MKKVLLTLAAVACAASVFAQGTVTFNNRITGSLITHVYLGGSSQLAGNGPTDLPAGSFAWGAEFVPLAGAGYTAALLAGPDLLQATPTTIFRTGAGAGFVAPVTVTLQGVAKDAPSAQVQMVAWDNKGGTINDWTAARAAWLAGEIAAGASPVFTVNAIGGDFNTPPNLVGLQSFNIYLIPEPSTFALAGLGAAALMIFRRRK
jgi:hypothetical protein